MANMRLSPPTLPTTDEATGVGTEKKRRETEID